MQFKLSKTCFVGMGQRTKSYIGFYNDNLSLGKSPFHYSLQAYFPSITERGGEIIETDPREEER